MYTLKFSTFQSPSALHSRSRSRSIFFWIAIIGALLGLFQVANAAAWYVREDGEDAAAGDDWARAKQTIQAAIDAAVDGDTVLVSNGVYAAEGCVVYGALTNRVAITKPIIVQSVNGPEATIIQGCGPVGDGAVRCAYVTNGALLAGFTLTNGATRADGDAGVERSGGGVWCEALGAVSNCIIVGNAAYSFGGGAYGGSLSHCSLLRNMVDGDSGTSRGGGACSAILSNCLFEGNMAGWLPGWGWVSFGGAAAYCELDQCRLTANTATRAGGAVSWCTLRNGMLTDNVSQLMGGGAYESTLYNCVLIGNVASSERFYGSMGGGSYNSTLVNCTLTGNAASSHGSGISCGAAYNCIIYDNLHDNWDTTFYPYYAPSIAYSCTTPLPGGPGNIDAAPLFVSAENLMLSFGSPCIDAGCNDFVQGETDCGDHPRIRNGLVDMGAYEYQFEPGKVIHLYGNLDFGTAVLGQTTNAVLTIANSGDSPLAVREIQYPAGFSGRWRGTIGPGRATNVVVTFRPSKALRYGGLIKIMSNATRGTNTIACSGRGHATTTWYVRADGNDGAVGTSWTSAKQTIQSAIDCAFDTDTVLVRKGTYSTGGRVTYCALTNRIAITRPITVRSVDGPAVTIIEGHPEIGDQAVRCAYVGNGARLIGFTLTKGATRATDDLTIEQCGGGVGCEALGEVSDCVITGNLCHACGGGTFSGRIRNCMIADNYAGEGGGAYESVLENCAIIRNGAVYGGGAVSAARLVNCTVTGNQASYGGGAEGSTLKNCIVNFNTASAGANWNNSALQYCCTTPLPNGAGNIIDLPQFVSSTDLHLSSNSPCIDTGNRKFVTTLTDLDGKPRVSHNLVDMGAYEYQLKQDRNIRRKDSLR